MPRNHPPQSRAAERDDPVTRTLRFDEDLRQRLEEAANRSVRSVNSEIIFRLRNSFEQYINHLEKPNLRRACTGLAVIKIDPERSFKPLRGLLSGDREK
jgi:Arc-like DNA binding domain